MKKALWVPLGLVLILLVGLSLSSCVRPRETVAPVPSKVAAAATATHLPATAAPTTAPTRAGTIAPAQATTAATMASTAQATATSQPPAATATTASGGQATATRASGGLPAPTATTTGGGLVATAAPATPAATGEITYEVRWGDNLSRIARQFGSTVSAIVAANPRITNPNRIFPGMVLVVPPATGPLPVPATPAPAPEPGGPTVHVVQSGETLSGIALRYGTTVDAIIAANRGLIRNRNVIMRGWRLTIPGSGQAAPSGGTTTYKVVRGDTLSGIANRFGTTVWAIVVQNNLGNANLIYVGQTLILP